MFKNLLINTILGVVLLTAALVPFFMTTSDDDFTAGGRRTTSPLFNDGTNVAPIDDTLDFVYNGTVPSDAIFGIDISESTVHMQNAIIDSVTLNSEVISPFRIGYDGLATSTEMTVGKDGLFTISSTSTSDQLVITEAGNIGIGTSSPNQLLTIDDSISLKEIAAANTDAAGYGQLWVKNAVPNELWFTDDGGTDTQLGGSSAYSRSATKTVCASDAIDTTNCDYIADGTDDHSEINTALSTLASTGGIVYLAEGTYNLGAAVIVSQANVALVGSGRGTELKRMYETGQLDGMIEIRGANSSLRDVTVNGNDGTYTHGNNIAVELNSNSVGKAVLDSYILSSSIGIFVGSSQYSLIQGNTLNNISTFVFDMPGADYIILNNNHIFHNDASTVFYPTGTNIIISNNYVQATSVNKLVHLTSSSEKIVITGNIFRKTGSAAGYGINSDDGAGKDIVITNNVISGSFSRGISIDGGPHIIKNNIVENIERDGIWGQGLVDSVIEGNIVRNIGNLTNDSYVGIWLYDTSVRNIVRNNIILSSDANKPKYGIKEDSTSDNFNTIAGNKISDTVTADILRQGASSRLFDNITEDGSESYLLDGNVSIATSSPFSEFTVDGCITNYTNNTLYWLDLTASDLSDFATTTKPGHCN